MDKLIVIPLLISAGMLLGREPKEVFILVFLPALTLLPTYFDTELVPGTPEIYFWSAALLPLLAAWTLKKFEGYRFHWMDLVIIGYILIIFYGQWANSDYKKAQKVLFNSIMAIYVPYILVRSFCSNKDDLSRLLKTMTLLGAFVAIFNAVEFRMFTNYFDEVLRRVWPSYVMWDTGMVMSRWGFKRALGPFSHPIVAGYFFSLITPIAVWCHFQGLYRNKNIGRIVVLLNCLGVMVALSRAPMLGTLCGFLIIFFGWSRNKTTILTIMTVVSAIVLILAIPKFVEYASVTRATAKNTDQRNVAYRKEMWEAYIDVALERPYIGWGRFSVPSVKGMESIDSEYLGVALASGVIVLGLYLVFLFGMLLRLLRYAYARGHDDPYGRLAWCIIAGWVSAIFSQATVYSGAQTVQYLFMLGGVGQILLIENLGPYHVKSPVPIGARAMGHAFGFSRVI